MKINVKKAYVNSVMALLPADDEAKEKMTKLSSDKFYAIDIKYDRNYKFHRKFFALLNYTFSVWKDSPSWSHRYDSVVFSFDAFRKNIVVLAGYYDSVYRLDGAVELEAKSISFSNLDQETFEKLYSDVIDVVLKNILTNYTRDDLDQVVSDIIGFS